MSERVAAFREWLASLTPDERADLAEALKPLAEPMKPVQVAPPAEAKGLTDAQRAEGAEALAIVTGQAPGVLPKADNCPFEHPAILEALRNHERQQARAEGKWTVAPLW